MPSNVEVRLTTIDNPFDPFDDFVSWFLFDSQKGYDSCAKVARVAEITDSMTDDEQLAALNDAIDSIIAADPLDVYKKAYRKTDDFNPLAPEIE